MAALYRRQFCPGLLQPQARASAQNIFGTSLFNVSCAAGLRWARKLSDAHLILAFPRYHPRWAWWLVQIPILREFLVSNLVVVLKNRNSLKISGSSAQTARVTLQQPRAASRPQIVPAPLRVLPSPWNQGTQGTARYPLDHLSIEQQGQRGLL